MTIRNFTLLVAGAMLAIGACSSPKTTTNATASEAKKECTEGKACCAEKSAANVNATGEKKECCEEKMKECDGAKKCPASEKPL